MSDTNTRVYHYCAVCRTGVGEQLFADGLYRDGPIDLDALRSWLATHAFKVRDANRVTILSLTKLEG